MINSDGLLVRFGREQGNRAGRAGVTTSTTKHNELVLEVSLAGDAGSRFFTDRNNDGTNDGFSGLDTALPSGCKIISQDVIVTEDPAGGTSYEVGTFNENGTAIDTDGIRTAAGANGAQVGTQLASNQFVTVTTVGTYTAGKVKIVVRYLIR